jgi:hypothetical protein
MISHASSGLLCSATCLIVNSTIVRRQIKRLVQVNEKLVFEPFDKNNKDRVLQTVLLNSSVLAR